MTQYQFELICKILENGAPVLAQELCTALDSFVQAFNALRTENEALKAKVTTSTETVAEVTAE